MRPVGTVTIAAALFSMTPKLVRYFAYFPFRRRQHRAIIGDVLYFVWRPWLLEAFLQVVEGVGANGPALAAQDDKSHWPIELRDLRLGQRSRNLLRQSESGYTHAGAVALFDVVVNIYLAVPDEYPLR
jgi:hypothetical protein